MFIIKHDGLLVILVHDCALWYKVSPNDLILVVDMGYTLRIMSPFAKNS
jgi:hypothetical protein